MILKKVIKKLKKAFNINKNNKPLAFEGSEQYWEDRYKSNKNSGAGSYGRLSVFKAEILNQFVITNAVETVIEFGCGDGNQLLIADYPKYVGYDVSKKAVSICQKMFKNDTSKTFKLNNAFEPNNENKANLVLSLDVIYHLVEDEVFNNYMNLLFSASNKYVAIYSSNYNDHSADHVKSRKFTDWIDNNLDKKWKLKKYIKNKFPFDSKDPNNTSMADFYIYEIN